MTKEESNFMPNRVLIRDMHNMISDMKGDVSVIKTIQGIETKRSDKHEKEIENMKGWRNGIIVGLVGALTSWFK